LVHISGSLKTSDGYYLVYGYKYKDSINGKQGYIAKLDTSANIIWEKTYGGIDYESFDKIIQLPDSSFIGVGSKWIINIGRNDLLIKFNQTGDSLWAKTFTTNDSIYSYFSDIQLTNDNGFIITGYKDGDMWLVKVDSMGCLYAGCDTVTALFESVIENNYKIIIYPNPFNNSTLIEFENRKNQKYTLTLYNSIGQIVKQIDNITTGQIRIERDNLTNGLYFFQLRTDSEIVGNRKFIIE